VFLQSINMSSITAFLQKSFQSFGSSIILPLNKISYSLVKCAKSHSYVETLGDHADSLHSWVKNSCEEDLRKAYEMEVRKALRHLNVHYAKLAFDITAEPFWGRTRNFYIFDTYDERHDGEFHFMNVCLIARDRQIPLMALPVHLGSITAKLVINLMEYCLSLFPEIRIALFDRGFYIAELIDYLEAKHIKYLMLVPEKKGSIEGYVEQTKELGKFRHEMIYSKDKSKWKPSTTIVVCKGIDDFAWIFATNINFRTRVEYIWHYKRRWQIETNFRVEDEARIKSKSCSYLVRYFYFLVSLLLHLLWIVNKAVKYYCPFKKYIDIVENELLYDYLEIEQM